MTIKLTSLAYVILQVTKYKKLHKKKNYNINKGRQKNEWISL